MEELNGGFHCSNENENGHDNSSNFLRSLPSFSTCTALLSSIIVVNTLDLRINTKS